MKDKTMSIKSHHRQGVFVELNGKDATARRGRPDLPCATISKAITLAQSGDSIFIGVGRFDIGTSAINIPDNVSLIGKGATETTIDSSVDLNGGGVSFCPGNNTIIRGLTIRVGPTHSGFGACVGTYTGQKGFVGALADQCILIGTSDVIYYHKPEVFKGLTIQGCQMRGQWDGISLFDGNHKTVVKDSSLALVGPPQQGDQTAGCHGVILSGSGGVIDIRNCSIKVEGPNVGNRGVWNTEFGPNSTINICGTTWNVTGTESKQYDVYSSSTLNVRDTCL